ncbi:DODA-type extradiol aromatic ring-opening family dioxygenase [Mariniluteicoccus flavus]
MTITPPAVSISRSTSAADALVPASHPFARHLAWTRTADVHRAWTPDDGALPALYLSHGAPPLLEDSGWMRQLHGWVHDLPRPRAVLVVSAHWESDSVGLTGSGAELVYDFGGFDPLYNHLRYDTPDAAWLAGLVRRVLPVHVHEHASRGLDHGAWVPMKAMFPEADVPVLQLSLPTDDPDALLRLGESLRPLRAEGVLIIGSGFMTHGLPFLDWRDPAAVPGWSEEFDAWASDALAAGDVAELARFRTQGPGVAMAHPTVEHFTPLFVTLGASDDPTAPVESVVDGFWHGLSKRSFQVV